MDDQGPDWRSLPRKSPADRHTTLKLFRCTTREAEDVARLAGHWGKAQAEVIRELLNRKVARVLNPHGAPVSSPVVEAPPQRQPLRQKSQREIHDEICTATFDAIMAQPPSGERTKQLLSLLGFQRQQEADDHRHVMRQFEETGRRLGLL